MYSDNLTGLVLIGSLACSVVGVCTTCSASIEGMPHKAMILYSGLARYYLLQGLMVLAVLRGRCYTAPADRPIYGGRVAFTCVFHNISSVCHCGASNWWCSGGVAESAAAQSLRCESPGTS